jgi:branched-chain amino acid aminotransferase
MLETEDGMTQTTQAPKPKVGGDAGIKAGMIWMNGEVVPQERATVSVLTHALHYGTSIFEGVRAYETPRGAAIFRLEDHTKRLFDSAHIMRMPMPFTQPEISAAQLEVVRINGYKSCYIRPLAWRGGQTLGVNPMPCPVEVMVAAWHWGAYLGDDAIQAGARLMTTAWTRLPAGAMPGKAKAGGNYVNSALARMDAVSSGFDEGLLLDQNGFIAEGTGENFFFINKGVVYAISRSVNLTGITRDSVIQICRDMGLEVIETMATREELYCSDEVFMTGTAAEVMPVSEIDYRKIGAGTAGKISLEIRKRYLEACTGQLKQYESWLSYAD